MLGWALLILVLLLVIGSVPAWPYSRSWGYGPLGGLLLLFIILVVLMVFGALPAPWPYHEPYVGP
jgi:hypothetical protein